MKESHLIKCNGLTRRCNRLPKASLVLQKAAKQAPLLSAAERGVIGIIMVSRRKIKEAHENSVLASFAEYLKSKGQSLTVKTQPDPPDAFVEIDGADTWIEITDAFYSQDVAISITSYGADDVPHRPAQGGLVIEPDEITTSKVVSVIYEKLNKPTMTSIANSNGKGILLVGLYGPFFDVDEVANNVPETLKNDLANQQIFESVYLYETCNVNVHKYKQIL